MLKHIGLSIPVLLTVLFLFPACASSGQQEISTDPQIRNQEQETVKRSTQDENDLQRVKSYLKSMRTLDAKFVQTTSNGEAAEGQLYLKRPDLMRIEYYPPTPILVVADGIWLIYYDTELEQVTHVPLSSTPASFLIKDEINFDKDITVKSINRENNFIHVEMTSTGDEDIGSMVMTFHNEPFTLKRWTIHDPQGVETTVVLNESKLNTELDDKLFTFVNPKFFKRYDR